jgi:hypothetical protein
MKKTMLRVALLSCATLAVGPAMASPSWGSYHWDDSQPAESYHRAADHFPMGQRIYGAEADWDQSTVLNLTPGTPTPG